MTEITFKPEPKQQQAWYKLMDHTTRYLVFGGAAGGGKTILGCAWLIINALAHPGTRYFIGREELKRLKQSIMPSMSEVKDKILKTGDIWTFNGQDSSYNFHNKSRIDLLDLKLNPSDPYYERYGSLLYTSGWIEEAGEVHFNAFDTLKSRINRWMNKDYDIFAKILITCNPKKNWLYTDFWRPWSQDKLPTNSCFIPALYSDNSYTKDDYGEVLASIKDITKRERLMKGNWEYADDKSAILDYDSIIDMYTNQYVFNSDEDQYVTCDPARFGADKAVVMLWQGWFIKKIWQYPIIDSKELRKKLEKIEMQHRVPRSHFVIDSDGIGGPLTDEFPGCKAFVNGAKPFEKIEDKYRKERKEYEYNFGNLKAQSVFHAAEKIMKRKVGIYADIPEDIKAELTADLEQWKKRDMDKDEQKVYIIPKEEMKENLGGRSPDFGDNIYMRSLFDLSQSEFACEVA